MKMATIEIATMLIDTFITRTLDLGCGSSPLNLYNATYVYGIDIAAVEPVSDRGNRPKKNGATSDANKYKHRNKNIKIVDLAVEKSELDQWSQMLTFAAEVARNDTIKTFLNGMHPAQELAEIFISVCGDELNEFGQNLIKIMALAAN